MIAFRHLILAAVAVASLMLSATHSFAQHGSPTPAMSQA